MVAPGMKTHFLLKTPDPEGADAELPIETSANLAFASIVDADCVEEESR